MAYREKVVQKPALLWKRVVAYLLDVFVILFILSPLRKLIPLKDTASFQSYQMIFTNQEAVGNVLPLALFVFLVILLYFSLMEFKATQTLGKMLLGIHVASAVKKERHFEHFLVRNLSKVSTLFLVIDSLPLFFSQSTQRYLERLSGTLVVQEEIEARFT